MTPRSRPSLALYGIFSVLLPLIVLGGVTVAALGPGEIQVLPGARNHAPAEGVTSFLASPCTVTSTADSGPGTFRTCLENAVNGDLINFDPAVFPPGSPVSITLTSALPSLIIDNLTIDASNAGVILDGGQVGSTPEVALLDDVNLTIDSGPNLITNGDFTSGSGHWRPWNDGPGVARSIASSDFHSAPNSYEWSVIAHSGDPRTVYDATNTSDPVDGYPLPVSSTVWISATGGNTVDISFWFRYGPIGVDLWILHTDGNQERVGDWWYAEADWTPAIFNATLPDNAMAVALVFNHDHSQRHARGLQISSSGNRIQGLQVVNFPGTGIGLSGNGNTLGGNRGVGSEPMGQGNLISGNGQWGVVVEGASANTISGNYVGTNISGTAAFGNAWMGITLHQGAHHNLVGGASEGEGNLISGNGTDGVWILDSGTDYNTIRGNLIGTDIDGMAAVSNGGFGVFVRGGAQYNTIGGDTPQERNLISGNGNCGLVLMDEGTDHNVVSGNYIGTDQNGTAAIPNPTCGVGLWGQPKYNTIGGSNTTPGGACSGACNLISGNSDETWAVGVGIVGPGTDYNLVSGNYIGTDPSGTIAVPNGGPPITAPGLGVSISDGAMHNTIGGTTPEERNLISGNIGGAVGIDSSHNLVIGNYIGVDVTGLAALGNGGGVGIQGTYNQLGGATSGERNIISGNDAGAVYIENSGTVSNTISGNYIGTDLHGIAAIPNGWGVQIWNGAQRNTVGGSAPGEGNVISGNNGDAIIIQDSQTFTNTVIGNQIGTTAGGTAALGNDGYGIHIHSAASYNVIGGVAPGEGNLISGNASGGIGVGNGDSNYNMISGNLIGTDAGGVAALPNGGDGVSLWWNASWNTVGISNTIAFNAGRGVSVDGGGTLYNTITQNSIHSNTDQGIALSNGGNGSLSAPTVTTFDPGSGTASGTAPPNCSVEVFSDVGDEGRWFEGETSADGGGNWAFSKGSAFVGPYVQATCTDAQGSTSEFSPGLPDTCPMVSDSADSGLGTLRQCLTMAEPGDTITFDPAIFLPSSPVSITLASGLPAVTQGDLSIDGSAAGVILDGSGLTDGDGFYITSNGNMIKGLQILNFPNVGVQIVNGASHNLIGGVNATPGVGCSGECNLISGNGNAGVRIADSNTMSNTISGNYLGVDATGSVALPNGADGILIEDGAGHNVIGGDTPGERNLISGNRDEGIRIRSGSDGNTIQGNYIGMDTSGTIPIGNAYYGIEISSGHNTIGGNNASPGGACSGECNLVSGNYYGIQIVGSKAVSNTVTGNYVGTDVSGTVFIPGLGSAYGANLFLGWDAAHNQVGGATPGQSNIIAGTLTIGPPFSPPVHNRVAGNHIGLDASGTTCLARSWHGISLSGRRNVIGGDSPEEGNRICGADHHGISISNAGNLVGYNEIFGNSENGVQVSGAEALTNTLTHNSIYDNGLKGIDLVDGGNTELQAPVVLTYDVAGGTASGTACALCRVEVFGDGGDEGRWYEGWVAVDASGDWAFSKGAPFSGKNVHATATDADGNTSEFSRPMHDIAVVGAAPSGEVPVGQASGVHAQVLNEGSQSQANVPVRCTIHDTGYDETETSGEMQPATWAMVEFSAWTPSAAGVYALTCQSMLPSDENPDNDVHTQLLTATLASLPDVWTKDNDEDTGDVPSNHPWWVSPDIWVRHQDDYGLVHQNPIVSENNTVYVRLRNRGNRTTSGEVQVFWDRSRIGWPCIVGQPNVGTIPFEDLAPGEVRIVSLQWEPQEVGHHGLHTVIQAEGDPADWSAPCSPHLPRWDNNVSWHNVIVYMHPLPDAQRVQSVEEAVVDLVNVYDWPKDADLIVERGTFPAAGTISLRLDEELFDRWWGYGWYEGIQVDAATRVITVTSAVSATIGSLPLEPREEVTATLTFDAPGEGAFEVQISERIDGLIVGGISYQWLDEDHTPPAVEATSPLSEAVEVALDAPIVVTFTEQIGPLSLELALEPDPGDRYLTWNEGGTVVTATYSGFESATTYTAAVRAGDAFANFMEKSYAWTFTVKDRYRIYLPLVLRNR